MIKLEFGDEIVASCSYKYYVLVFTKRGYIYKLMIDEITYKVNIEKLI